MISADTPVLFVKACEIFVMELTLRAWMHTQQNKRKTVQRNDIAYAIRDDHLLAFLNDMVPLESRHRHEHEHVSILNTLLTLVNFSFKHLHPSTTTTTTIKVSDQGSIMNT